MGMVCQLRDDEVDAAVVLDDLEHTASQHGDDDEFAHADDAIAHGSEPSVEVVAARGYTDDARQHNAQCQNSHDIHAHNGRYQHYHIGQHLQRLHRLDGRRCRYVSAHCHIEQ